MIGILLNDFIFSCEILQKPCPLSKWSDLCSFWGTWLLNPRLSSWLICLLLFFSQTEPGWYSVHQVTFGPKILRSEHLAKRCLFVHKHSLFDVVRPVHQEAFLVGRSITNPFLDEFCLPYFYEMTSVPFCFGRSGFPLQMNRFQFLNVKIKTGSKLFYLGPKGFYLFRDKGKPLDAIGGWIKDKEDPVDALKREFREETGKSLCSRVEFAFVTASREKGEYFLSYVFVVLGTPPGRGFEYCPYGRLPVDVQPWTTRHARALAMYYVLRTRCMMHLPLFGHLY